MADSDDEGSSSGETGSSSEDEQNGSDINFPRDNAQELL